MKKPKFPIKGNDLIQKYGLKEGKELGQLLNKLEDYWIKNHFKISSKDIDKILKN